MTCADCRPAPTSCGACESSDVWTVVCLGDVPLANALLAEPGPAERFPLHVIVCGECAAVQLTRQVPPAVLFGAYPYYSSQSSTMVESAGVLVDDLVRSRSLGARDLVVEIGSNDGYLLRHYVDRGVRVLGVDPADGPADVAERRGVQTLRDFFGPDTAAELYPERAAVVHANNVLAHVPDPGAIVAGVRQLLAPDGVFVIETPWLGALLDGVQFDTIYHEHRWYWSVRALDVLLRGHGMEIRRVELIPLHGGSLRVFAGRARHGMPAVFRGGPSEDRIGRQLRTFGAAVIERVALLRHWLEQLTSEGTVAAYGAAAKGTMLCNAVDWTPAFVVDSTPAKQGRWIPGVCAPVVEPEQLEERMPEHCVVMAWNFAEEIAAKAEGYTERGGKLWVPAPEPRRIEETRAQSA